MMEGVGSWLAVVQMRRRDPFGVAVGAFSGGPVFVDESVVGSAGEGELVDVGGVGSGPPFDVMDFAVSVDLSNAKFREAAAVIEWEHRQ